MKNKNPNMLLAWIKSETFTKAQLAIQDYRSANLHTNVTKQECFSRISNTEKREKIYAKQNKQRNCSRVRNSTHKVSIFLINLFKILYHHLQTVCFTVQGRSSAFITSTLLVELEDQLKFK